MNINPDYESDSQLDAELAMEMCMQGISDLLLQPAIKRDELSEEDQTLLGIIGMTLKTIAQKAQALENLEDQSNHNKHFRN
tara:strand:+ start:1943 stop:2185 length:243 start_codon:yes stop_codon:yes gene_type:complete